MDKFTDDQVLSAWVTAMHGWIATGAQRWEDARKIALDELHKRKLGRRMTFVQFDKTAFEEAEKTMEKSDAA